MHNGSLTGSSLLEAASCGNAEAVWQIAANEPYADVAYTNPRSIWPEVLAALKVADEEMAAAIGTCLLEHMLEVDFVFFHRSISDSMQSTPMLAEAISSSAKFGQSLLPPNSAMFDALKERAGQLRRRA